LRNKPDDLAVLAIDIPIGLLDGPRACDKAARKLLGQPRGSSVFPALSRPALGAQTYPEASCPESRLRDDATASRSEMAMLRPLTFCGMIRFPGAFP